MQTNIENQNSVWTRGVYVSCSWEKEMVTQPKLPMSRCWIPFRAVVFYFLLALVPNAEAKWEGWGTELVWRAVTACSSNCLICCFSARTSASWAFFMCWSFCKTNKNQQLRKEVWGFGPGVADGCVISPQELSRESSSWSERPTKTNRWGKRCEAKV